MKHFASPQISARCLAAVLTVLVMGNVNAGALRADDKAPGVAVAAGKLSDDQINHIMEFLQATQPEVFAKAQALRQSDPKKFEKLIGDAAPNFWKLEELQKRNPLLATATIRDYELTHKSFQIADQLRRSELSADDTQKLRLTLRQTLTEQFEVRQKMRQIELDELTKRIEDLKAQLKDREHQRENILKARETELVGQRPRTDW